MRKGFLATATLFAALILFSGCDKTPRGESSNSRGSTRNGNENTREKLTCPENAPLESPEGRICNLYRQYPTRDRGNSDAPGPAFSAYFSPELRESVEDVSSLIDLIYCGYTPGIQGVRIETAHSGKVRVTLATYGDETKTMVYSLKNSSEGWKIDDIRYPEGRTLRANFEAFSPSPEPSETDPEHRYVLIRQRYMSLLPLMYGDDQSRTPSRKLNAIERESRRLGALLDALIDPVVGPVQTEGMPRQQGNNLTSCGYSDGCTQVDGILLGEKGTKAQLVSTKPLVQLFFQDWKEAGDLDALSKVDELYTYAVGQDAGFESRFEIPVQNPDSLTHVRVLSGNFAQDLTLGSPFNSLVLFATRGERVLIATQPVEGWVIRSCNEAWKKSGGDYSDEAAKAYSKCYQEKAPGEPGYPDLVRQAQAFADHGGPAR